MSYLVGIDIGGTFTDCIVMNEDGRVWLHKASSTPEDFSRGFFDSLRLAAAGQRLELAELLSRTDRLVHGTTVATNALVQRKGAKTGLITTRGQGDVLRMMRGYGRAAGLPSEEILHFQGTFKPDTIIPRELIKEVSERIDARGDVVVPLNEEEIVSAVEEFLKVGVEAIAISFLWSFRNPINEARAAAIVRQLAPKAYVTVSSELLPVIGEYERTTGTVINSSIGSLMDEYLSSIVELLRKNGYRRELLVMSCNGGVRPASEIIKTPIMSLHSGPVAGVVASGYLGEQLGAKSVLATDVGGTTFDVGLVINNDPVRARTTTVGGYEFYVPHVAVKSIGAGGGSLVWFEETSGVVRVGPQSAGADPGPACYGRGNTTATLTDADLVLGYLNEKIAEGSITLDVAAATAAIQVAADAIGMGLYETAAGIARVVEVQMANMLNQQTINVGHDPRKMVILAYGGAGALHAGIYGERVGASRVIIPMGNIASGWSALGCVAADLMHAEEKTLVMREPFDVTALQAHLDALEEMALESLARHETPIVETLTERFVDMRYMAQINEVEVAVAKKDLDAEAMIGAFHERYESIYGKGSGFRGAGISIVNARVRVVGKTRTPNFHGSDDALQTTSPKARNSRLVYWNELHERLMTPAFTFSELPPGSQVKGPAVFDLPDTTVVIHPGHIADIDAIGNVVISFGDAQNGKE